MSEYSKGEWSQRLKKKTWGSVMPTLVTKEEAEATGMAKDQVNTMVNPENLCESASL